MSIDEDLISLLTLSPGSDGRQTGGVAAHSRNNSGTIFGGVLLGQAVVAAGAPPGKALHFLSSRFIRGGAPELGIEYEAIHEHDGGSFANRRVAVTQNGKQLADFALSFHKAETGLDFEEGWSAPPPRPEDLPHLADATSDRHHLPSSTLRSLKRTRGLEIRVIDADAIVVPGTNRPIRIWVRIGSSLADRPDLWAAAIAYLSDFLMAGPGVAHHTFLHDPGYFGTTLNHALWLHRRADPSCWLLHEIASHWTGGGRTLNVGRLYDEEGRLVASSMQEALLRRRLPKKDRSPAA